MPTQQQRHQLPHQEQGNAGVLGHGSVVTALSVPRSAQVIKNPAIADGVNDLQIALEFRTGPLATNHCKQEIVVL